MLWRRLYARPNQQTNVDNTQKKDQYLLDEKIKTAPDKFFLFLESVKFLVY